MYKRILVANRADCATRLIQACHLEGAQAYVIAARDDARIAANSDADGIVYTGMSRDAYTNQDDILEAARQNACEAILPGWGFLSEDFAFARRCRLMGMHFIGPTPCHLQFFGDKYKTIQILSPKQTAISCAAPDFMTAIREQIHGAAMLKCRFGGGGKNIHLIQSLAELQAQLERLQTLHVLTQYYVEPAIKNGRHIEFQYLGDGQGNVLYLGARDCSWQKNHQKFFEAAYSLSESPKLQELSEQFRQKLAEIHYLSWGTIELLVENDDSVHVLELNPRLQVEHGVTEMTSHIDIVRSAIRISCSNRMELCMLNAQNDTESACEFRLFARSTGILQKIGFCNDSWPKHPFCENPCYRIESAYHQGDEINGAYDGLIARFILSGHKTEIRDKLRKWLADFELAGVENNLNEIPE